MGEHSTSVNGKGKDIRLDDILAIAGSASISRQDAGSVIEAVIEAVSGWNDLVLQYDVPSEQRRDIHQYMSRQQRALSAVTVSRLQHDDHTPHPGSSFRA